MNKLIIAIWGGEKYCSDKIEKLVNSYFNTHREFEFKIEKCFLTNDKKKLARFDIIFINLCGYLENGMENIDAIRKMSSDSFLVIISDDERYAVEGYRYDIIRYLLRNSLGQDLIYECMDAIIRKKTGRMHRMEFQFREGQEFISLDDLMYIESKGHKLYFYIGGENSKVCTLYAKLDSMDKKLSKANFIRIHKSFLVNYKSIEKISNYKVWLKNKILLPVPRVRYRIIKEQFENLIRKEEQN